MAVRGPALHLARRAGRLWEVSVDTLNPEQIGAALAELNGWGLQEDALVCTFRFADFAHAIEFVDDLADVAEEQRHHPDIDIRYNKVMLHLTSHDAGGITQRDVKLAEAVQQIVL